MAPSKKEVFRCEEYLRTNVNYATAIMQDPERFKVTAGYIAERLEHWIQTYRIAISPLRYLSEEGIMEVIHQQSDAGEVHRISERALEYTPAPAKIDDVLSSVIYAIFSLQSEMEWVSSFNQHVQRGVFRENEKILTMDESYERAFLRKEGLMAGLFFSGGGVSNSSVDITKSNLRFRNVSDLGYLVFATNHTDRFARMQEVYCDGKFTGPCQFTIHATFVVVDNSIFKSSTLGLSENEISSDMTWSGRLVEKGKTKERHLLVNHCKLLPDGVYDFQKAFGDFIYQTREELLKRGIDVAW